jgi:hypothetical protein
LGEGIWISILKVIFIFYFFKKSGIKNTYFLLLLKVMDTGTLVIHVNWKQLGGGCYSKFLFWVTLLEKEILSHITPPKFKSKHSFTFISLSSLKFAVFDIG